MKFIVLALALFGAVALAAAQEEPEILLETYNPVRFRRETDRRGSVVITARKPENSLNVDYNHRIYDKKGATVDAFGGLNVRQGQRPQQHLGLKYERNFKNGFVHGFGQVERGQQGRPSPTFGLGAGFRF